MTAGGRRFVLVVGLALAAGWPSWAALAASPTPVHPNLPITENSFYATRLTCPDGSSGPLRYWTGNKAGWTGKITVEYAGSTLHTVDGPKERRSRNDHRYAGGRSAMVP